MRPLRFGLLINFVHMGTGSRLGNEELLCCVLHGAALNETSEHFRFSLREAMGIGKRSYKCHFVRPRSPASCWAR